MKLLLLSTFVCCLLHHYIVITDGITNRCGSFYMGLCASCFAAPLVAVRLNYKFVTKSYVFTDHFNQSNFHFVTIQMFLFISDILFLCLIFPKYNLSICIVHFWKVPDSTIFVYKCLVICDLLRVTEHHCCKGDWQQDSVSCCICMLYRLCRDS